MERKKSKLMIREKKDIVEKWLREREIPKHLFEKDKDEILNEV